MPKILIGLDNFYYSLLSTDTTAGVTYQAPVALKGAVSVSVNMNSEVTTIFADDGPFDTAESMGQIELDITIVDCSQEDYAALMGHTIVAGVLNESVSDQPPDLAFGFRALRSNSAYSYIWLLKGKFSKPEIKHETKSDKLVFQTLKCEKSDGDLIDFDSALRAVKAEARLRSTPTGAVNVVRGLRASRDDS